MMSKRLVIKQGAVDPNYISLLSNVSGAVESQSLEVLKAVAYGGESGHFEDAPTVSTWKRAIVSPVSSNIVFKLFFPRLLHRRLYYSYLPVNPIHNAYQIHQKLSDTGVRTLKSSAYGYLAGAGSNHFWFIALERLASVISYEEYAKKYIANNSQSNTRRNSAQKNLITYVAQRLSDAHNEGFYHEDLKPYHIFIDKASDAIYQDPTLTSKWLWIDLDDSEVSSGSKSEIPYRRRIINLYQSWRYLLLPYGIDRPDGFVSAYLSSCPSQLPRRQRCRSEFRSDAGHVSRLPAGRHCAGRSRR